MKVLILPNTKITGAGIRFHAPYLKYLDLSECPNLTDVGLHEILTSNGDSLETLDLADNRMTGNGLTTGFHAPRLQKLNLTGCKALNESCLLEFLTSHSDSQLKAGIYIVQK